MDAAGRFSRARAVEQASSPRAEDRPEPPRLPGDRGGMARPDATADHIQTDTMSPAPSSPGKSPAGSGRPDFFDPPRVPDDLGRLAHYRVRRLLGEGGMGHGDASSMSKSAAGDIDSHPDRRGRNP